MQKEKRIYLYPIIAVLGIIPFIVYNYVYSTGYGDLVWYTTEDYNVDFFLYCKAAAIIGTAIIMACMVAYRLKQKRTKVNFSKLFVPLFIYGGLTLLSGVFSEYSYYCFYGSYDLFESVWVILGYVVITYYAYLMVDSPDKLQYVLNGWFASIGIMCALGFTQLIGHDFFATTLGKKLISTGDGWEELNFTFEKGRVYLSLYNPNYVGSYAALIIPLLLVLLIFQKERKTRIISGGLLIGTLLCLLGSQSRTGILCIGTALVLLVILCFGQLRKYWKPLLGLMAAVIVVLIGFNQANGGVLLNRLTTMFTPAEKPAYAISAIDTNDENIAIYYNDTVIYFQYTVVDYSDMTMIITVYDENGTIIDYAYDEESGMCILNDERFPDFRVAPTEFGIAVFADGIQWNFTQDENRSNYFYNACGKAVKLSKDDPQPNRYKIFDYIGSFSGRDHIWSNSIPLLKNSLILGSGPDTFTLVYPQEFYIYKAYNGLSTSVDVKPHNMYLQIGIQSGVPALIAVLIFYGLYFVQSIKIYRKEQFDTYLSQAGIGIFIGTFAYMLTGLANDSSVTVAPIFWALMGIGISINAMLQRQESK